MRIEVTISKQFPIKTFDTRVVGIRWLNILLKYKKLILADYERTVQTWNTEVTFKGSVAYRGANPTLTIGTNNKLYEIINNGTNIRYDVMDHDPLFLPKTKVGVLRSVPGRGGVAWVDMDNPRDGIAARRFAETITFKYEKNIQKELLNATLEGLRARKAL